mgnify:CR=1 FL=1
MVSERHDAESPQLLYLPPTRRTVRAGQTEVQILGRSYKTLNFRQRMTGNVTEHDGRVFLFGFQEVGPVELNYRFHFFKAELPEDAWERVRARHKLPKAMRHTCHSWGVRKGEGRRFGGPWSAPWIEIQLLYPPENF